MASKFLHFALMSSAFAVLSACNASETQSKEDVVVSERPNLLLIIADDLAYTDLGVYGGEIDTPNIDRLAKDGLLFTDFHNQAVCGPTRAALLAGTDSHNAGGGMHQTPAQKETPGYESYLNFDVVTLPRLLNDAGYNTYWAGKWHLGTMKGTGTPTMPKTSESGPTYRRYPPRLGEHNAEIRAELKGA